MKSESLAKDSSTEYVIIQVRLAGTTPSEIRCQVLTDETIMSVPPQYHRTYGYAFTFKNALLAKILRRLFWTPGGKYEWQN